MPDKPQPDEMADQLPPGCLGEEHCAALNTALRNISEASAILSKLKAAGLDVSEAEAKALFQKRVASSLKAAFFPDRP